MIGSKTVLVWSTLDIFVDSGQNQTPVLSQLGREARWTDTKFLLWCPYQVSVLG